MTAFRLPDIGEGLDQAEIIEWLVEVGDVVVRDQPLVEILTDKSQTQLPAPDSGVITRLGAEVGDLLPVGEVVVEYEPNSGAAASPNVATPVAAATQKPAPPTASAQAPPKASAKARPTESPKARPKASPAVRKQALVSGVDLHQVIGTGPGGRITAADLTHHTSRSSPQPSGVYSDRSPLAPRPNAATASLGQSQPGVMPLRGVRRVTAETMQRAWLVPHIHGADEFDATALMQARAALRAANPDLTTVLTPLTFMVMAVANALRTFPLVNASLDLEAAEIHVHSDINIGVAVSTERGLLVPVVRNADRLGVTAMAAEIRRITASARDNSITAPELRGGTCTVTNYGSLGGRYSNPIIKPPESAIVGFGSIRERPLVVDGEIVARRTLPIATAVDHRLIDGDLMTAFQEHIIGLLLSPVVLVAH